MQMERPQEPMCYGGQLFSTESDTCVTCPWYLSCGSRRDHDFGLPRKKFIQRLMLEGHRPAVIDAAVSRQYGISAAAAKMARHRIPKQ
jgi:hypothetical protein